MSSHAPSILLRIWRRVVAYLGFRGAILLLIGTMFVGIGVSIHASPPPPPQLFYSAWPILLREALWTLTGLAATAAAIVQTPRWQRLGFGLLFLGPCERAAAYGLAMFTDLVWSVQLTIANLIIATFGVLTYLALYRRWSLTTQLVLAIALACAVIITVLAFANLRWAAGAAIYTIVCGVVALTSAWPEPVAADR